jgi:cytochrome c oxidase subunit 4
MAREGEHSGGQGGHPQVGHIVPIKLLVGVGAALMFLTAVTVWARYIDLGNANLFIAMVIATIKASLVVLYFMHLKWDRPFNSVVLIAALAFVSLFVSFALMDRGAYQEDLIPDYAPAIQQGP